MEPGDYIMTFREKHFKFDKLFKEEELPVVFFEKISHKSVAKSNN